jgi:hypothetical protein
VNRAAPHSSARLGLTLRAILLEPSAGFEAAVKATSRRERAGQRPVEGVFPYVLAAAGGASWFVLWLKIGALAGLRNASLDSYRAEYLTGSVLAGAALGLIAQRVWALIACRILDTPGATGHNLRLVWGAAAFPQLVTVGVLLPLDLVLVGPGAFTTDRLGDPLATAWAALSIALAAAFAVWSGYLFVRGIAIAAKAGGARTALAAALGFVLVVALFAPPIVSSRFTG